MIVSQLARSAGVTPHAVRYYSRIGLLNPPKQHENHYRQFGRIDVRRLMFIKKAKRLGFTLDEIRHLLEAWERGESTCPIARDIIAHRLEETEAEIAKLVAMRERMRMARKTWLTLADREPDGETVCHLIESFSEE